jgi:probable rRNA maturation factor
MIAFNYETDFQLENEEKTSNWILECIEKEGFELGEINYIFCDDAYLHKINIEFLNHDTLTDIISFDYTMGKLVGGDIFISVERVAENANDFNVSFENELHRVIMHGVLHYMGFKDKTEEQKQEMRAKENECLALIF